MQAEWDSSVYDGGNASYLESLYDLYLQNPQDVPQKWRDYFAKLPSNGSSSAEGCLDWLDMA